MTNLWVGLKLHSHGIWQAGDGRRQGDTFWLAHEKTKWSGNNVLPCDVVLFIQNRIYSMKLLWLGDAKYWKSFFRQHCRPLSRFLYILWSLWRKVKQICMAIVAGIHFYLWQCENQPFLQALGWVGSCGTCRIPVPVQSSQPGSENRIEVVWFSSQIGALRWNILAEASEINVPKVLLFFFFIEELQVRNAFSFRSIITTQLSLCDPPSSI